MRSRSPPGSRPTTTRGCPSGGVAAARRGRRVPGRAVAGRRSPRTSAPRASDRRARRFAHRPPPRRRCSTATALHRPAMVRGWAAGRRRRRSWQAELWRRLRERLGRAEPGRARSRRRASGCAPSPGSSTCRSASRSSASRACPPRTSTCCGRSPPAATCTCSCCIRRPRCGRSSARARRACCAAPRTRPPTLPANRLLASWGQDAREMQLVLARRRARRPPPRGRRAGGDTLLARIQADVRADRAARRRSGDDDARRSTATAASRSTPATAARARSRSSATRSCTCSPRTRRSSRAT